MNDELRAAIAAFNGQVLTVARAQAAENRRRCGRCNKAGIGEKLSDALGVHPDQVPEAMEHARRHGVPTDFAEDGRAVIRSRAHQKALCKVLGFHNKDGGYGD